MQRTGRYWGFYTDAGDQYFYMKTVRGDHFRFNLDRILPGNPHVRKVIADIIGDADVSSSRYDCHGAIKEALLECIDDAARREEKEKKKKSWQVCRKYFDNRLYSEF